MLEPVDHAIERMHRNLCIPAYCWPGYQNETIPERRARKTALVDEFFTEDQDQDRCAKTRNGGDRCFPMKKLN